MSKGIRGKRSLWIILAVLIVPTFVFWGFGTYIRSKKEEDPSTSAGTIFGRKVTLLEYRDAYEAVRNQALMLYGDDFSEKQKYLNLEGQAWDRLILLAEAKKRRLYANDAEVVDLIQRYPTFQRRGRFDQTLYSQMLQYVFHTQPRIFEEQTRQNAIIFKLYDQTTSGIKVNEEQIKEEYRKQNEQFSVDYISAKAADFLKDLHPTEQEIRDYFSRYSLDFKRPLSFNLQYIILSTEGKNEQQLNETAKKIFSRLKKGEMLAVVAKDFGLGVKETGLFGQTDPIPGIGWAPQLSSILLKLKAGEYLSPLLLDKTYYIFRLKERKGPDIPDFDSVKDKVAEALIKNNSQKLAKEKIEACLKKARQVYQNTHAVVDLTQLAQDFGLPSGSTELFKYGGYIPGIGIAEKFFLEARGLQDNEPSGIIEMPGGYYIIKLKSRIPVDEEKLEKEKKEFAQSFLAQKKQEYFAHLLEELKKKVRQQ